MFDIYFKNEYGRLYENQPKEKFEVFEYSDELGKVSNRFIKKEIPKNLKENKTYYDLATPYGYGGPIIEKIKDPDRIEELVSRYEESFQRYAKKNNIVAEFVRFHPILSNEKNFKNIYDVSFNRKTTGTDLRYDDPFQKEFSKSTRKQVRRILRDPDISYEVIDSPDTLDDFMQIYYSTMDRNDADDSYYFSRKYFNNLLEKLNSNLVIAKIFYKTETIAMGLYFKYKKLLHAHLSGTLSRYLDFSPAYILKYALTEYGKENGYKYIHYGGGKSDNPNDSLYYFKHKFAQNTEFDFYIGKKIWNKEVYDRLSKISKNKNKNYFPIYRK